MGQLLVDRRCYEIDDADLVNLQPVLMQALSLNRSVALAVHGRDGEEHVLIAGRRPLSLQFSSAVTASGEVVEQMLDELALLGSLTIVGVHTEATPPEAVQ
ncbi:hypothetical protein [Leifsonia sp. NPDC077715]|uniref:hypothetical protein n=1 Tax=Leifsonia sp. NPDC077715 TaxID=3155539 RepID=UPI003444BA00